MPTQCSMIVLHLLLLFIQSSSLAASQNLSLLTPNSSSVSDAILEWTAMGDSYASGIGAGTLPQEDRDRCFRCSNAYPNLIQSGPGSLQPSPQKFNFVACSGAKFSEILDYQLIERDRPGRPAWGTAPQFVTITMGGNDVGILYLVLTCIYSVRILGIGCDAVIQRGFTILDSQDFIDGLSEVIRDVRYAGRRLYGRDFHIYVTGYARLFNSATTQCDQVTFRPSRFLLPAEYLTRARRLRMNELAVALNRALEAAVAEFPSRFVTFVDYDPLFEGHRFCDRNEPNPNDDDTWFFQLGTTSDPIGQATGRTEVSANDSRNDNNPGPIPAAGNVTGRENAAFSDYWRVFHPKSRGHQAIRNAIIEAISRVQLSRGGGQPHDTF